MDGAIDLRTADRDVLIGIIIRQQAVIERLEKRVAQLEGRGKSGGSGRMPGLKPPGDGKPDQPKTPRQPCRQGFARTRMTPTQRVEHAPVVHADETGWQEDGHNGYVWTFSTPDQRYFLRRGRSKEVVDEVLGAEFAGVLVSDFYAAYHHYDGPKQRCWAHLLRDSHDLRSLYPEDGSLAQWAEGVHQLYCPAKACTHSSEQRRRTVQLSLERRLLALCRPYLDDPLAAQAKRCRRIDRHIQSLPRTRCGELFVFVAEPAAAPDNNAAERSLRPVVISRKISGGTRSSRGSDTKMTLASMFGTWRAQGLNPLTACRQLLASPQL